MSALSVLALHYRTLTLCRNVSVDPPRIPHIINLKMRSVSVGMRHNIKRWGHYRGWGLCGEREKMNAGNKNDVRVPSF